MPLEMNPEIRARWTAALRSGDYQQGYRQLRSGDCFCCLGVLCDLAAKDGIVTPERLKTGTWSYAHSTETLPASVVDWAALSSDSPRLPIAALGVPPNVDDDSWYLTELNDEKGWSFAQIADAIDGGAS